jgi:hypothetical protein
MDATGNSGENRRRMPVGRPFPPGVSGNPDGRPKKHPYSKAYEKTAGEKLPKEIASALKPLGFRGKTWADAVSFGQHAAAVKGETPAAKEIADRVEGKVAQPITGADGAPLIPERASLAEEAARLLALVAGRGK